MTTGSLVFGNTKCTDRRGRRYGSDRDIVQTGVPDNDAGPSDTRRVQDSEEKKEDSHPGSRGSIAGSGASSIVARKRKLEYQAAEARTKLMKKALEEGARLEMDLIQKRLEAELAELDEEVEFINEHPEPANNSATAQNITEWLRNSEKQSTAAKRNEKSIDQENNKLDKLTTVLTDVIATLKPHAKTSPTNLMTRLTSARKLPIFEGNPLEWIPFKRAFDITTELNGFTDKENVLRLCECLRGEAKETVDSLLLTSGSAEDIMASLELRFGNVDVILGKVVEEMKRLPRIGTRGMDLPTLAAKVRNCVVSMQSVNHLGYLHSPELINNIIQKMSSAMIYNYNRFANMRPTDEPRLVGLSTFLTMEAEMACKAGTSGVTVTSGNARKDDSRGKGRGTNERRERTSRVYAAAKGKDSNDKQPRSKYSGLKCSFCNHREHRPVDCEKFQTANVDQRWRWAKRHNLCFRCLKKDHRRLQCQAEKCGIGNCNKSHHRLLHKKMIAREIGTNGPASKLDILGVGGMMTTEGRSQRVSLEISDIRRVQKHLVRNVQTVAKLKLPQQTLRRSDTNKHEHLKDLPISYYVNAKPTILLGQDNWYLCIPKELRVGGRNLPVASLTELGWVVHGYTITDHEFTNRLTKAFGLTEHSKPETDHAKSLNEVIQEYFELESIGISNILRTNRQEERAQHLQNTTTKRKLGRWETGLLWHTEKVDLPNNYSYALERLKNLERRMDKEPELANAYTRQIEDLIKKGYAEKLTAQQIETGSPVWYLPHFGVKHVDKPNKLRIVFDAAAKCHGTSLNDVLLPGPDLLNSLLGVLMRFRQRKIAFVADIKEMFLQIKIREEDRDVQRFLWRETERNQKPDVYRMSSMIFGAISSPSSAQYVKNRNADEFATLYPEAVNAIKYKHYVDDYLDSVDTEDEAKRLSREVTEIHRRGGFQMCGWTSNSDAVMKEMSGGNVTSGTVQLTAKERRASKTLGLYWDAMSDTFSFNTNKMQNAVSVPLQEKGITKREMVRTIMSIFDPLGFLAPFTIKSKILLQNVWRSGITWDENLRIAEMGKWKEWTSELQSLGELTIPRCYVARCHVTTTELHVFCDASELAYAAVAYWKFTYSNGRSTVAFICSKSRVTPLKPTSIPRLELQAALLASRLGRTIETEHEFKISRRIFWTDSNTVLSWIQADPRSFKTFVSNRLAEIDELTTTTEWRWISGKQNPADHATRNRPVAILTESNWFHGPDFLTNAENSWPRSRAGKSKEQATEEECRTVAAIGRTTNPVLLDILRFSSWLRLIRTTARILIFVERCKKKRGVELTEDIMQRSEKLWIRQAQEESFGNEIRSIEQRRPLPADSRLIQFSPEMDDQQILRLKGRVSNIAGIAEQMKRPVLLDGKHPYTRLLVRQYHESAGHGSTETVLNELRQRYWILKLRPTIRWVAHQCVTCRIRRAKSNPPRMSDLPLARLGHHQRPFTHCGMDYFGPLTVTVGRRHEKRWGVLFTCLTTRAIHLELVNSLTTDSTIMALRRMGARRGFPSQLYSDNATNLKGADREIKQLIQDLDQQKQTEFASSHRMIWKFIPPASPHMGGSWERLVRSVKTALKVTLKERSPKEETLQTVLLEAERTVNSRPLTHVSVDPRDPEAITPYHFLIGTSSADPLPNVPDDIELYSRKQWRVAQRLADHFWNRWVREYLPTLQPRRRWTHDTTPIKTGSIVIIADHLMPRNMWLKGIVKAVYPGADGRIRVAEVKTQHGTLRRPVVKLIVLPVLNVSAAEEKAPAAEGEGVKD
ncbi:uncharacterized protein LOC143361016 [Halictus rubicundus]|uniref:uncharacterized protein LOC143361016 n=1 Tax=Halictus rubicundus TaxID=77578 RepID=UPI00403632B4